jgi:hypothetical protein
VICEVPADSNSLERDRVVILGNHRGPKISHYFNKNCEEKIEKFNVL